MLGEWMALRMVIQMVVQRVVKMEIQTADWMVVGKVELLEWRKVFQKEQYLVVTRDSLMVVPLDDHLAVYWAVVWVALMADYWAVKLVRYLVA